MHTAGIVLDILNPQLLAPSVLRARPLPLQGGRGHIRVVARNIRIGHFVVSVSWLSAWRLWCLVVIVLYCLCCAIGAFIEANQILATSSENSDDLF